MCRERGELEPHVPAAHRSDDAAGRIFSHREHLDRLVALAHILRRLYGDGCNTGWSRTASGVSTNQRGESMIGRQAGGQAVDSIGWAGGGQRCDQRRATSWLAVSRQWRSGGEWRRVEQWSSSGQSGSSRPTARTARGRGETYQTAEWQPVSSQPQPASRSHPQLTAAISHHGSCRTTQPTRYQQSQRARLLLHTHTSTPAPAAHTQQHAAPAHAGTDTDTTTHPLHTARIHTCIARNTRAHPLLNTVGDGQTTLITRVNQHVDGAHFHSSSHPTTLYLISSEQ